MLQITRKQLDEAYRKKSPNVVIPEDNRLGEDYFVHHTRNQAISKGLLDAEEFDNFSVDVAEAAEGFNSLTSLSFHFKNKEGS